MTYSDIKSLKTYLNNSIKNLDAIKDSKDCAANAKMFGANEIAQEFLNNAEDVEDTFRKNLVNMIAYMKVYMNEHSIDNEHYSAQFNNTLS